MKNVKATVNQKLAMTGSLLKAESTGLYVKTQLWKEVLASVALSIFIVGVAVSQTVPYSTLLIR